MTPTEPSVFDARFVPSIWLPFSAVAFALIALFPVVTRRLSGQSVTFSWIGLVRAAGCFSGLWASGIAVWLFRRGTQLSAIWPFGLLGLLLAFPWRVITRAWVWWGLFAVLLVFTLVPLLYLGRLFVAFVLSPPIPWGTLTWPAGGLLPVAFLALQALAVWRLRRRSFRYDRTA